MGTRGTSSGSVLQLGRAWQGRPCSASSHLAYLETYLEISVCPGEAGGAAFASHKRESHSWDFYDLPSFLGAMDLAFLPCSAINFPVNLGTLTLGLPSVEGSDGSWSLPSPATIS